MFFHVCYKVLPGLVFHKHIYKRGDVMQRIHSHLRSERRRSLQVPNFRTSKDYLYRRVSGQSSSWQKSLQPQCRITKSLVYRRKERMVCNVILI
jgi:hypothetical protein